MVLNMVLKTKDGSDGESNLMRDAGPCFEDHYARGMLISSPIFEGIEDFFATDGDDFRRLDAAWKRRPAESRAVGE